MDNKKRMALARLDELPRYQLVVKLRQMEINLILEYCKTKTNYHEIYPEIAKAILDQNKERIIEIVTRW